MSLILYYHPLASYCHKVLIALYENGTDFEKKLVDLADAQQRAELQAVWALAKFPVIRDHDRGVDLPETTVIIEYLDRHHPGPRPLVPRDWEQALQVRLWDRVFDNHVQGPMQEIVNDRLRNTNNDMDHARTALDTVYTAIDRQLDGHEWIVGNDFSLADCAAAPALFYASTLRSFPADSARLAAYFERLVARPSVRRTLDEAKPWLHFYPFADAVPQRFR